MARPLRELIERQLMIALELASIELSLNASEQIESDRQQVLKHNQQTIQRATWQSELPCGDTKKSIHRIA